MLTKAIIFDFDGVLADSFINMYALNKTSMAEFGIDLSENQYRDFFMGNIHAAFRNFIKDNDVYQKFSEVRKRNFDRYYLSVKLFSEAAGFLNKIKEKFILTIASSGKQDGIVNLLKTEGFEKYFRVISASSDYSKERIISGILEELGALSANSAFVSDTCGDLILAKTLGLKPVGVGWGFQSSEMLSTVKPDFIAGNFNDLFEYLIRAL